MIKEHYDELHAETYNNSQLININSDFDNKMTQMFGELESKRRTLLDVIMKKMYYAI